MPKKSVEDKKVKDNLRITACIFGIPYLLVCNFILLKKHFIKDNNSPISSTSTQSNNSFQDITILADEVAELKKEM